MKTQTKHKNNIVDIVIYQNGDIVLPKNTGFWKADLTTPKGNAKTISGGRNGDTHNKAALEAIIQSLDCLKFPCIVSLHIQSSYIHQVLNKGWLEKWAKNNWYKTGKKIPVEYAELWSKLYTYMQTHEITIHRHENVTVA